MGRKSHIERFCLSVTKDGTYNLINSYTNDLFEGKNREALICEVAKKLEIQRHNRSCKITIS